MIAGLLRDARAAAALERYLGEQALLAILRLDADGYILEANGHARRLFSGEPLTGALFSDRIGPIDLAARAPFDLTCSTPGVNFSVFPLAAGFLAFGHDRRAEELEAYTEVLRQHSLASLKLMEDALAAQQRAEKSTQALRESEAQFRLLVEGAPDAIFVHIGSRFAYLNAAAVRLFEASSAEELTGRNLLDRIDPSFHAVAAARIDMVLESRQAVPLIEQIWLTMGGRQIPVDVSAVPVTYQGQPASLIFARDISGRKDAERALSKSEQKYRAMLEAAPDAVVVTNSKDEIVVVNSQAEELFGYSREILLRMSASDLCGDSQVRELPLAMAEHCGLQADGTAFPIEIRQSEVEMDSEILIFRSIRDVTARKLEELRNWRLELAAREAEAANKAKSVFLSTMSHEIRTPLNAILGYSQLMSRDASLSEEAKENLRTITRSGAHLLRVITDVLDMAKIEAGKAQVNPSAFAVRELLNDMEAMFRLAIESKGLSFVISTGGEPVRSIVADEGKVRQILINLLGNAVKFTQRGHIHLSLVLNQWSEGPLWLSVQVEDTGVGMTPEEQEALFQPFAQGKSGKTVHHGGTGLGLAIGQRLAHLMGGQITITSRPGQGSTCGLEIPAERAFECGEEKRSVHRPRVTGIRAGVEPAPGILVVDDVEDNSDWLRRLLKTIGFPVRVAGSGEAAIAIWEDWRPGLILMDIHMPGIDGLEAAKRIKALPGGRQTVIVALTADSTEVHRGVILSSGADDFLSKPCQEDELLEKIRLHLGLSYIYADGTPEGVEGGGPGLEEREAELLDKLPARFVNSLREATLNGNRARLEELIEEIRQCGLDKVAALFQELADSYQYDRLVELLESEENHAASTS